MRGDTGEASVPPSGEGGAGREGDGPDDAGMPRWVKVSGVVGLLVVLALVLLHLTGNSPGGHAP